MKLSRGLLFNSERLEFDLEGGVMKMAKLRKMLTHRGKNESGQGALAMVLILLMLGAIILTPLLVFMSTGLKAGQVYESKMQEFYAADSGVEDGLWRIKNDELGNYSDFNYTPYPYVLPEDINDENVAVNITNVWIPTADIPDDPGSIIESGRLIVTGSVITFPGGDWGYQIKISYYYDADPESAYYDPEGANLKIDEIGVWLSGGFDYVPDGLGNLDSYSYDVNAHCGGKAIIWDLENSVFKDLPGGTDNPGIHLMVRTFDFQYSPSGQYPQALSWVETSGVSASWENDFSLSWEADSKPYRIESTAGSTTAEAYVIKNELRKMGAAISGEYVAVGNSLLTPSATSGVDKEYRDRLYLGSSATVASGSIPADATMEGAYLYWSGWIDYHYWKATTRHGHTTWRWDSTGIPGLNYDLNTPAQLIANAKVNTVKFGGGDVLTNINTSQWQVMENVNHPGSWSYSCFYDLTKKDPTTGKSLFATLVEAGAVSPNGSGTYTLSHADAVVAPPDSNLRPGYPGVPGGTTAGNYYSFTLYDTSSYTGYPLGTPATKLSGQWNTNQGGRVAYAGWSLIIIYSSPETKGHQLYLYDDLLNCGSYETLQFPISGFLAPDAIRTEGYAAKLTCFVGDGDDEYSGDYIQVNSGAKLSDGFDPNNVWNSKSVGLSVSGVDIDTFTVSYPTINPGDILAQVKLPTDFDQYNLVYIILSFRSDITTGGTVSYLIRGG